MTPATTRRRLLATVSLALVGGVTGCSGTNDDGTPTTEAPTGSGRGDAADGGDSVDGADTTSTPRGEGPTSTSDADLDLREANVVTVAVAVDDSGSHRFDVTLFHDDDVESGYADWWQVELLEGERLGRRTLLHAHSTAPFTRSAQITIPDATTYVVVRGHDQTHGYGGQAMVVNVRTGETEAVRQGPEPRDFSAFEPRV